MFILILVQDTIRVSPHNLNKNLDEAVRDEIHIKYVNKVIPNHGLVVGLYSYEQTSDAYIYPSDGGAHVKARFKLVVFRPVVGEVINGKVKSCDHTGIRVTLEFFDAIFIPATQLPEPSTFDVAEQLWKWEFEGTPLYMDLGQPIRFRVLDVIFGQPASALKHQSAMEAKAQQPLETREMREARIAADHAAGAVSGGKGRLPMTILGTCKEDGLGMIAWWTPPTEEAAEGVEGLEAVEGEAVAAAAEDAPPADEEMPPAPEEEQQVQPAEAEAAAPEEQPAEGAAVAEQAGS